jgi:hypothetical protein
MAARIHLRWAAPSERSGRTLREAEQIGGSAQLQAERERERERERRLQTWSDIVTHKWHEIRRWYASRLPVERRHILVTVNCLVRRPPMGKMDVGLGLPFPNKCCPVPIEALRQANLLSK